MLPGFDADQIRSVGNTSLAGALLTLLVRNAFQAMENYRSRTEILELNTCTGFEDAFIDALALL